MTLRDSAERACLSWQISYHEVLTDFPFKSEGDETSLRNMELAELIIIGTVNGQLWSPSDSSVY